MYWIIEQTFDRLKQGKASGEDCTTKGQSTEGKPQVKIEYLPVAHLEALGT